MEGFRHENKYFISQAGYQFLRGRLAALMQTDPHAAREDGRYWIRSLYFDGYGQSALLDKRDGIQDRENSASGSTIGTTASSGWNPSRNGIC